MGEGGADWEFLTGTDEAPPRVAIGTEEETLDLPAGRALCAKACRQDGGVVAEEGVAPMEIFGEIREQAMRDGMIFAVNDE